MFKSTDIKSNSCYLTTKQWFFSYNHCTVWFVACIYFLKVVADNMCQGDSEEGRHEYFEAKVVAARMHEIVLKNV